MYSRRLAPFLLCYVSCGFSRDSEMGRLRPNFFYRDRYSNRMQLPDDNETLEPAFAVRWTPALGNTMEITAMMKRLYHLQFQAMPHRAAVVSLSFH